MTKTSTCLKIALLVILGLMFSACSMDLEYEAPRDQISDLCSGSYVNTSSNCVTSKLVNSNILSGDYYNCKTYYPAGYVDYGDSSMWQDAYYGEPTYQSQSYVNSSCSYVQPTYLQASNTDALIIVTEPGNVDATANNLEALRATFPRELYPHFRTLQNNILSAFLIKTLQTHGSKYGRIYLVRSDVESKSLLLGAIKRVTAAHKKVDLFLTIHGNSGSWALNPTLTTKLTADELVNYANSQLSLEQRNKVRAVFSTACFQDQGPDGKSMNWAITTSFPSAATYGSYYENWAPMHRDFVAFESYYAGSSLYGSMLTGNSYLRFNQATGQVRDYLYFPIVKGRGCYDYILGKHCENRDISLGSYYIAPKVYSSEARAVAGVSGSVYAELPKFCKHPFTGVNVQAGVSISYYTRSVIAYDEYGSCSNYLKSSTCTTSGTWSPALPSTIYSSCRKQVCTNCLYR